jgi:hypothetical protein
MGPARAGSVHIPHTHVPVVPRIRYYPLGVFGLLIIQVVRIRSVSHQSGGVGGSKRLPQLKSGLKIKDINRRKRKKNRRYGMEIEEKEDPKF